MGAQELARLWIECWNRGEPDAIPLSEDFVHTSPFGRVEGKQKYLEWVKPLAAKNVADLKVLRTVGGDDEACVIFDMRTPSGMIPCCDWVRVKDGLIQEIHSFYDATELRATPIPDGRL